MFFALIMMLLMKQDMRPKSKAVFFYRGNPRPAARSEINEIQACLADRVSCPLSLFETGIKMVMTVPW